MKYVGMPMGMWWLFRKSFRNNLVSVLDFDPKKASETAAKAKQEYKKLIRRLPEFEKKDRFKMNIVSCAMFSSFCLSIRPLPSVDRMTDYYRQSMLTSAMRWFCRKSGKRKFSAKDVAAMKASAALRAADRNPFSWNFVYLPYPDGSGYEARFCRCGICVLMKDLGLYKYVPAMCALDYTMAEIGGACRFTREYTLASGGPYCDCGYRKLNTEEAKR